MFQIGNADDKKTEWNLNETRIIIPLIDGDSLPKEPDKIVRAVNFIPKDGDQNSPTGKLGHSLVIGLDKNIFEQHSTKSDLLIIQDSDFKLLSCNPDLKNQLGYSLSFIDQDRSETLWENSRLKDKSLTVKTKEWSNDSAILEVKDILIYDDKPMEEINLDILENESKSLVTKSREDVESEEIVEDHKNEKNFQLIINYIPECYNVSSKGETGNCEILVGDIKNNGGENIFKKMHNYDVTMQLKADVNGDAAKISDITQKNVVLPEKSLPLKKKAKMKKTMICSDNQRSLLKEELVKSRQQQDKSSFGSKVAKSPSSFVQQDCSNSDSKESLSNKTSKRKKNQKPPQKSKKQAFSSSVQETKYKKLVEPVKQSTRIDSLGFDITKFQNIYDLVEGLRKYRMISVPVWQILNTGLKEMNVDILKEIMKKRKEPEGGNYSAQLKAFALVLYFKQPVAFNFLAKVCNDGWPSLNVIKEWKLQLNSHQRPNFLGVERKAEDDLS